MSKQAVIKWNANQLQSIKRDMLLFEKFYYDPYLLKLQTKLLENVSSLVKHNSQIIDEIYASVEFLKDNNILQEFELNDFKKGKIKIEVPDKDEFSKLMNAVIEYDKVHKLFLNKYNTTVEILEKNFNNGFLKYIALLEDFSNYADYHIRLTTLMIEKSKSIDSVTPIIKNLRNIEEGKETQILRLVINNLPIPDEQVPIDEIIDFRNDSDNRRRYLGLMNWVNKISKSSLNLNEIEDELQFYTLEFENRLKLEKTKYRLSNLEVIISLPFEIAENVIKLNWGKIPKLLFQAKKNKVNLMIGETKAPGREMAYISYANNKYRK